MKAIEFYSGIGGWSCGFQRAGISVTVDKAFDINEFANLTYAQNFGRKVPGKTICNLSVRELESIGADIWVMSPPCQPHSRNNTTDKRDMKDPRSDSFIHLLNCLEKMSNPPRHIFLEVRVIKCFDKFIKVCRML